MPDDRAAATPKRQADAAGANPSSPSPSPSPQAFARAPSPEALLSAALLRLDGLLVALKDRGGRYAYANDAFLAAFGLKGRLRPGESTDADLFPTEVARVLRDNDRALSARAGGVVEETLPFPDGTRAFLGRRFAVGEGGWLGWAAQEITRRARAESDLFASREFFRSILDIAADAIVAVNARQRIILFNQGAERIFQYRAEEVLGQPLDLLIPQAARRIHRRHVERFRESRDAARQMGQRGSIFGRRKDGAVFPAEASISRVRMNGDVTFTAILRDISAQRRAEEAIERLNADLRQRAAQLEAANRELEAFSYSVSHDLRAPLRGIEGFSQVLLEDYAQVLDATGQGYLHRIRSASRRMAQLIDDLLELSRLTRGGLHRQRVDLSALARDIVAELRARQPERRATFIIADDLWAEADPHLIQVVPSNLLSNSWKYTSKHPTARIEFGVESGAAAGGGRGPVYFVKDDGVGFDMAYADKLFGAFQRLHGMTEYPGTGIGLATVQRIVHKHGGEVWAEAEPEKGAVFRFTLA